MRLSNDLDQCWGQSNRPQSFIIDICACGGKSGKGPSKKDPQNVDTQKRRETYNWQAKGIVDVVALCLQ